MKNKGGIIVMKENTLKECKDKLKKEESKIRKLKEIYLKKYRNKLEENYQEQEKLLEYEYFNRTDLLAVITYLVERIENSAYELCYYNLTMHHEKEYQDDTKTYNETKNYWQKTELNQDMNNCLHIITNIKNIIAVNEDFCEVLENKTSELGKAR